MRNRNRFPTAFTLVELLVVIAIIGVLVALLLPAVQAAREAARRTQCTNTIKQYGIAIHNYHDTFKVMPPGAYYTKVDPVHNAWGWRAKLLPFMEQQTLYDLIDWEDREKCWNSHLAADNAGSYLLDFAYCPSEPLAGLPVTWSNYVNYFHLSNYMGVAGRGYHRNPNEPDPAKWQFGLYGEFATYRPKNPLKEADGCFFEDSKVSFRHITDGLSNTFVVGEHGLQPQEENPWSFGICAGGEKDGYIPMALGLVPGGVGDSHERHFWGHHPGGVQFLKADGSGHFISTDTNLFTLIALSSIAGEEIIDEL
jgi:prepilin-type N-terminal cleavage/methylation domain-containing protein